MTWGHARTGDFLEYEELTPVLHPDENGTMFSGCGIINERGLLGLPKDALILFYTAAGGTNPESEGKEFTIRMAYSVDGGNTYVKFGEPVLDSLAAENRDPKVFWHEESGAYILVLWLEEQDFAIFLRKSIQTTSYGSLYCIITHCMQDCYSFFHVFAKKWTKIPVLPIKRLQ